MPTEIHTWQAFKYHFLVWKVTGLQPPKKYSAWRIPYIIYALVLNLSVTILFPVTLIIKCCLSENLNDLCESLYVTISGVVLNLRFLNLFIIRKQLLKARPILEQLDARARTTNEIRALQEGIDSATGCFMTFFRLVLCICTTGQWVVYMSKERTLIYQAWFPFEWKNSKRNYLFAYWYQFYAVYVQAIQVTGSDTYPQAYLTILTAHIKALSLRLGGIGNAVSTDEKRCNNSIREIELQQQQHYRELIECIKDHKIIINLYVTIQNVLSVTCLAQFISTGLGQCTIGVYMLNIEKDYSKLANVILFMCGITFQLFILCYYGDRLSQESLNLTDAIYSCNWTEQNKDFKKALLLLLQRSQKGTVIMAGYFLPVGLPIFVQVIKTAYSVFAVLNEVK